MQSVNYLAYDWSTTYLLCVVDSIYVITYMIYILIIHEGKLYIFNNKYEIIIMFT